MGKGYLFTECAIAPDQQPSEELGMGVCAYPNYPNQTTCPAIAFPPNGCPP